MAPSPGADQIRRLAGLTVLVLAAHALLLGVAPQAFTPAPLPAMVTPLRIRTLPPEAPATPTAAAPAMRPDTATGTRRTALSTPPPADATAAPPIAVAPTEPTPAPQPQPPAAAEPPTPPASAAQAPDPAPATVSAPAAGAQQVATAVKFVIPPSARLRYQVNGVVRRQPYEATGLLEWRHDGREYQARLEVSVFLIGARSQTSVGRLDDSGLAPLRFGDKSRSEQAAHFQRERGVISFSSNAPEVPLLPGAQDRLSVLLQLGAMIAAEPEKYPRDSTISIQTASTREADPWVFTVIGEERLQLPGGERQGLKLLRLPRHEHDARVELWLAPDMDFLPVRLRLTQANGDVADQRWVAIERP